MKKNFAYIKSRIYVLYINHCNIINNIILSISRLACKLNWYDIYLNGFEPIYIIKFVLTIILLVCKLDFEFLKDLFSNLSKVILHMNAPVASTGSLNIPVKEGIIRDHAGFDGSRPILSRYSDINRMLEAWDRGTPQEKAAFRLAVIELGFNDITNNSSRTMGDISIRAVTALNKTNYDGAAALDPTMPVVGGLNGQPFHAGNNPFGGNRVGRSQCQEALKAHLTREATKARSEAMNINNILN